MQFRSITELHWNTTKKLLFVFTLSVGISTTEHSYNQVTRKHFITFLHEDRQHLRFLRAPIISANRRREYKKPHHFWTFVFTASTSALTYYKKKKSQEEVEMVLRKDIHLFMVTVDPNMRSRCQIWPLEAGCVAKFPFADIMKPKSWPKLLRQQLGLCNLKLRTNMVLFVNVQLCTTAKD